MYTTDDSFFTLYFSFLAHVVSKLESVKYMRRKLSIKCVLAILYIGKNVNCSMKNLLQFLRISEPSTLTRTIDTLVKLNLVYRKTSTTDKRFANLELTEIGMRFYQKLVEKQKKPIQKMKNELGLDNVKYSQFFTCIAWLSDH